MIYLKLKEIARSEIKELKTFTIAHALWVVSCLILVCQDLLAILSTYVVTMKSNVAEAW